MELLNLSGLKSENSTITIINIRPLSGSIYLVQGIVENPPVEFNQSLAGKYLKLNLPIGERCYSIEMSENNQFHLILGGSSVNKNELEFLEYAKFCILNYNGVLLNTTYSVEGRSYLRKSVNHNKLFIAAGTGFSFIKPLFYSALKFYEEFQESDALSRINVDLIWSNHSITNVYDQSNYNEVIKKEIPNLNFKYSLLIEKIHKYQEELLSRFNSAAIIEINSLLNHLKDKYIPYMKEHGLDLSKTIIYIGGSYEVYKSVTELLIKELNADPVLIVCDHKR